MLALSCNSWPQLGMGLYGLPSIYGDHKEKSNKGNQKWGNEGGTERNCSIWIQLRFKVILFWRQSPTMSPTDVSLNITAGVHNVFHFSKRDGYTTRNFCQWKPKNKWVPVSQAVSSHTEMRPVLTL